MLLLSERPLSAEVSRKYGALELLQDVLLPPEGNYKGDQAGGQLRALRSYRRLRGELLDLIKQDGGLLSEQEMLQCAARLRLKGYGLDRLSIYVERRPTPGAHSFKAHVFYDGKDAPHGSGHGHGLVLLKPDGSIRRVRFHKYPHVISMPT